MHLSEGLMSDLGIRGLFCFPIIVYGSDLGAGCGGCVKRESRAHQAGPFVMRGTSLQGLEDSMRALNLIRLFIYLFVGWA